MISFANALIAIIAVLHVIFLVLEMFLWTKPVGLKIFQKNAPENERAARAQHSAVLAANQGLYNGFLAAGLFWGLLAVPAAFAFQIKVFFLLCVIIAGIYGAATIPSKYVLLLQAAPAAFALCLLWFA
jgi:putative membrane protein